jgi:transposase|tara:strand:+ start:131 stop:1510 length:1380 start_codon:yes stop_codon:yes gene_type:complete
MTPAVKTFVLMLVKKIAELEAKVEELSKRDPKLTPENSSLPPSSEHPHAKSKTPKSKGSRKRRGAQPGHPKHDRELIPSDQCDQVIELKPEACRKCGQELGGEDSEPLRHQVWELPEIRAEVKEYQRHRLGCPCCGTQTCASLPPGIPQGQSGPRLIAFAGLLMGHYRQSKRRTALFLQDFLKMPCSEGLTVKMHCHVAQALEEPYEELKAALGEQSMVFMDETPTKQAQKKAWLWTVVAPKFAVFAIFPSRKGEALDKLLGDGFDGVIHCDRAKMYWQAPKLQWCWAHLKRDFQALIDYPDNQVKRLGYDLMRQVRLIFKYWRRYQNEEIGWESFRRCMRPVRKEVEKLLGRGKISGNKRLVGMCRELYGHQKWLWAFTQIQGIEPTNNTAERALRPAVIQRKLSFGTQSETGSRFLERMLSVSETCRLQQRSVYDYLVQAVSASFSKNPPPSLLPAL